MQDQPTQRAVLALLLDSHPKSLALAGLVREVSGQDVERAVAELVGVGLVERDGDSVRASAAAVHFERLELP